MRIHAQKIKTYGWKNEIHACNTKIHAQPMKCHAWPPEIHAQLRKSVRREKMSTRALKFLRVGGNFLRMVLAGHAWWEEKHAWLGSGCAQEAPGARGPGVATRAFS